MISCGDLERICGALTQAFSNISVSFGGKSIILAGDFAQLPPPGRGSSLYSPNVGTISTSASRTGQQAAIGKSLWHTFTTVVLLRQNMRQTGASAEDIAFRIALSNMRYAQCTAADINLLQSRVYSPFVATSIANLDRFDFVSVITARNAHRDAFNESRNVMFAAQRGSVLHHFHSVDGWGKLKESASIRQAQRDYADTSDPVRTSDRLGPRLQSALWALRPSMTDHHAGVLSLCEGMPVLLKSNEATELCATNGAPGFVHGWDSHTDSKGREYLDVLFVRLNNPPRNVQIADLPLNVIPITRSTRTVKCTLPFGDTIVSIQRSQVACLPNFALTDFACQGLTRTANVIHPICCRNHQSLYTVFSRSSSFRDTVILEGFAVAKLQGGTSPALMQEF
ncbi:hypothetical protein C2E23DRAFT_696421, partial [Lenzites betulinus]